MGPGRRLRSQRMRTVITLPMYWPALGSSAYTLSARVRGSGIAIHGGLGAVIGASAVTPASRGLREAAAPARERTTVLRRGELIGRLSAIRNIRFRTKIVRQSAVAVDRHRSRIHASRADQ